MIFVLRVIMAAAVCIVFSLLIYYLIIIKYLLKMRSSMDGDDDV